MSAASRSRHLEAASAHTLINMLHRSSTIVIGLCIALFLAACGDDGDGPGIAPPPHPRDAAVDLPDASGPVVPPTISRCEAAAPVQIGDLDEDAAGKPDGVDVIARPGTTDQFLLVTARLYCPLAPDASCDGIDGLGPESHTRRRALLYAIKDVEGAPLDGPYMVNLGVIVGTYSHTTTTEPRLTVANGNLVVAWLDTADSKPRNVWAAAVNPTTLKPLGPQQQISAITSSEGSPSSWRAASKFHLVGGSDGADVVYQSFGWDDPAPTLHSASISPLTGARLGNVLDHGEISHSDGGHGALRNAADEIVFGRTERLADSSDCSYFLGVLGEEFEAIEENSKDGPCGDIALTNGATVYAAENGGSLRFRPLGVAGAPIGRERKLLDAPRGVKYQRPAVASFANGFFVSFVEVHADGERLRGLIVDSQGGVVSEEMLLDEPREDMSTPSIAIASGANTIAIAWKDRLGSSSSHRTNLIRVHCE